MTLDGSGIDAVATTPERIDLVVRDSNGHVQQIFGNVDETTNRWRDRWVDRGRTFGPPTITKTAENKPQIFAFGPNNVGLWKRWDDGPLNGGRWDWIKDKDNNYPRMRTSGDHPPRLTGQFAAVKVRTTEFERIDLIARTTDGRVMHTEEKGDGGIKYYSLRPLFALAVPFFQIQGVVNEKGLKNGINTPISTFIRRPIQ